MKKPLNIIVTGASRGIGFDTVLELSKNPNNQIYALSRNAEKLQLLRQSAFSNNVQVIPFDLTDYDQKKFDQFLKLSNHIDVLINNAGLLYSEPFEELSLEKWKAIFEVNLFGIVQLIKGLLPKLKRSTAAHILNIGSMGGFQGSSKFPGLSAYSASKAALANLTECLAQEFVDYNIKVNCLALGAVQTEMLAEAFPGYQAPVSSLSMSSYIAWFAQKGHEFHNGKIIPVALSTP